MKRINTKAMMEHILNNSQHRKLQTLSMISHKIPCIAEQKSKEMDKIYLNLF